jgi:hypothetical protein
LATATAVTVDGRSRRLRATDGPSDLDRRGLINLVDGVTELLVELVVRH